MWNNKDASALILRLVFVVVFGLATNVTFAQTPDQASPVRDLATKLLAATTESDQNALLEAQPGLITVELAQALRKQVETLIPRREFPQAFVAAQLTRSIAERIGDEQDAAFAVSALGVISLSRGEYQQALEFF